MKKKMSMSLKIMMAMVLGSVVGLVLGRELFFKYWEMYFYD